MNESERAVMESARFAAMESYFEARPQIAITRKLECIFEAGFDAAYAEVRRLREQWQYYQDFCKQNGFDGITAMAVAVDKLREENERLRENAKTIGELEQLAARSNNNLLVEIERLRAENERQRFDILAMNQSLDLLREENERLRKDAGRFSWLALNVKEQLTRESLHAESAEHKTMYVLPKLVAWADFCGSISFSEAVDYAIGAARGEK